MRLLERWHVPRMLAALLLILAVFGTIVGLRAATAGPASAWAAKLPEGIPRLQERLSFLQAPINTLQRFLQQMEDYGQPAGAPAAVSAEGSRLMTKLLTGTRNFASGLFTTILFLFFLLVSGDTFLRRLVEILPSFSDKRQAVDISQQIESDISAYLVTITLRALSGARRSPASMPFEKSSTAVSVQAFSLLDDQVFDRKTYRAALPQLDYRERSLQCRVRGSDA